MKFCLECGEGGHLKEMTQVLEAFSSHEIFFVIVGVESTKDLAKDHKVYYIKDRRRHKLSYVMLNYILIAPLCLKILLMERPDAIISTGGLATIPLSYIGKILRIKIIYIESLTRVFNLSGNGRLIYPIADLFLVQWESLVEKYKKAKYWGKVI